jgi:acetyl esterase/lipase
LVRIETWEVPHLLPNGRIPHPNDRETDTCGEWSSWPRRCWPWPGRLPRAKFSYREKFGDDPAKHKDFSAVTHVAKGKGIPPFLILHVAGHPDTTAQAQRLGNVLKEAGVPVTVFGARETTHGKINADLGRPDDPATKALDEFLDQALKK